MRIELVNKNYNESSRLLEVIEKKINKLDKFFDAEQKAKVQLTKVGQDKFRMEITLKYDKKIVRAEITTDNMYDNIDLLLPKIEKQIVKYRARMSEKDRKPKVYEEKLEEEKADKVNIGKIVKVKNFSISKTTVEDAIAEMELLDHNFHIFVNAEGNKVSIVYKRNDGDYGLISPEY